MNVANFRIGQALSAGLLPKVGESSTAGLPRHFTLDGKLRAGLIELMPLENLTRTRIVEALSLLGRLAEQESIELEVCIYGGSAMLLAYGCHERTKDVDAIVRPSGVGHRLASEVASRLGLHDSWLNEDVKRFVSDSGTFAPLEIQELEASAKKHLKISRASASYLLAMKCLACRSALPGYPGDIEDIRFLIRKMNIRTLGQIEDQIARFYPYDALTPQARAVIQELLPKSDQEQT